MVASKLDFEILRKGRPVDEITVHADPADTPKLQDTLAKWLESEGWDRRLWPQFSADVRLAGENKVRARGVRVA